MKKKFHQQQEELKHFGVLGMKWGQRRRAANNARVAETGKGTFKPTYQYRDSQGNVVSRYGPGKYGGPKGDNEKPVGDSKSDKKFMRDVERMSKTMPASVERKRVGLIDMAKTKYRDLPENKKTAVKLVGLFAGTTLATIGLIKGSKAAVSLIQQMDDLLYKDAINGIAMAIVDMHKAKG